MTKQYPLPIDGKIRTFAMVAAGILLNLGLSFLLTLLTPIVVGIVCGYILHETREGILSGILSALFAYALIFIVTGYATDLIAFGSALLIMCVLGGVGGYIGIIFQKRVRVISN
jgi:hypothetical protein